MSEPNRSRQNQLHVRVNDVELQRLQDVLEDMEISWSVWVRQKIRQDHKNLLRRTVGSG